MAATSFTGDVWVGTSLGILKGVSVSSKDTLSFLPPGLSLKQTDRSREVMCMSWDQSGSKEQLYMGLYNGLVQSFDCKKNYYKAESNLSCGRGHFVGISKHQQTLITCTNEGVISFWPDKQDKSEINVGCVPVDVMVASPDQSLLVATGGKNNDLKLWDGNRPDAPPIFKARNLPHDSLKLQVPVWVTSIGIVPGTGERPCVAVGTGHHHLRIYDTRAKRKPVYNHLWEESRINSLDVSSDGRYYLVGNAHGQIARIDLRKGSVVNRYHGFGGSVSSLSSHGSVFAACGLDRYLIVYQVEPPKVIHKVYIKLLCKSVLMSGLHSASKETEEEEGIAVKKRKMKKKAAISHDEGEEESSGDELWDTLATITAGDTRRSKLKRK